MTRSEVRWGEVRLGKVVLKEGEGPQGRLL